MSPIAKAFVILVTFVALTRALLLYTMDWTSRTITYTRHRRTIMFGFCVEALTFLIGLLVLI